MKNNYFFFSRWWLGYRNTQTLKLFINNKAKISFVQLSKDNEMGIVSVDKGLEIIYNLDVQNTEE